MLETSRVCFLAPVVQSLFSSGSNLVLSSKPEISTIRSYGLNDVHKHVRLAQEPGTTLTKHVLHYMDIWTIHHHLPLFIEGKRMSLNNLWVRLTQLELLEHIAKPKRRRKNAIFYHWRTGNEIMHDACYVVDPLQI